MENVKEIIKKLHAKGYTQKDVSNEACLVFETGRNRIEELSSFTFDEICEISNDWSSGKIILDDTLNELAREFQALENKRNKYLDNKEQAKSLLINFLSSAKKNSLSEAEQNILIDTYATEIMNFSKMLSEDKTKD